MAERGRGIYEMQWRKLENNIPVISDSPEMARDTRFGYARARDNHPMRRK